MFGRETSSANYRTSSLHQRVGIPREFTISKRNPLFMANVITVHVFRRVPSLQSSLLTYCLLPYGCQVEELLTNIKTTEDDVERWKEACELEVQAAKHAIEERDKLVRLQMVHGLLFAFAHGILVLLGINFEPSQIG